MFAGDYTRFFGDLSFNFKLYSANIFSGINAVIIINFGGKDGGFLGI